MKCDLQIALLSLHLFVKYILQFLLYPNVSRWGGEYNNPLSLCVSNALFPAARHVDHLILKVTISYYGARHAR
jgi:hypothetical protein